MLILCGRQIQNYSELDGELDRAMAEALECLAEECFLSGDQKAKLRQALYRHRGKLLSSVRNGCNPRTLAFSFAYLEVKDWKGVNITRAYIGAKADVSAPTISRYVAILAGSESNGKN